MFKNVRQSVVITTAGDVKDLINAGILLSDLVSNQLTLRKSF